MKKFLSACVCVIMLSGVAFAQTKPDNLNLPEKQMKMRGNLATKLGLSEEQKVLADKIRKDGKEKMKPLIAEKKALHEKMDNVRKQNMAEFEKILTPEQKKKFDEIKITKKKNKKGSLHKKDKSSAKYHESEHLTHSDADKDKPEL